MYIYTNTHIHQNMYTNDLYMQICLHTRLTTHELFLSLSLFLSLFHTHTHTHTQGSNTHVQAPMPANESFFTNVMPL